ncbi:MAG: thioredoxin domain-containing protein [Flavobacteriaceae bacterium]
MNELHNETSPYLLQHKDNPVFWKGWHQSVLEEAQKTNKLLIISIGYSACHWCHVMEHESFEDEEVAAVMNENFINIKVDREERPDVDAIYMKAVQLMTQRGGWPLNVVALPDGKPVWGGTYFRKNEWINSLEQLHEMYRDFPEKMEDYALKLQQALHSFTDFSQESPKGKNDDILGGFLAKWSKSFDWEFGGYVRAPKFMMPSNYNFLLRYAYQTQDEKLLDYVNLTLTKMAYGGVFDVIDGGFSRYSVDMKWHVPHFEKMLYDNGQLLNLYSKAYKLTKNELYKEIVKKTADFVEREWLTEEGGFYSAFDADSLNDNGKVEEGAFYVWRKQELEAIFEDDFPLFSEIFNCNDFGVWENGNYVLIQNQPLEEIAQKFEITISETKEKKAFFEKTLFKIREKRHKPRLDDKIITSWNAMTARGFIEAYKAFGNEKYLEIAQKNIRFIKQKLWSDSGNLFRTYKNETPKINAFLEDYACVIDALIGLYEVTLEENHLRDAKQLTDYVLEHFYDSEKGFFRFTSREDAALVSENYEIEDNVIDSSNSVMAQNLYVLSVYFLLPFYEDISRKMTQTIVSTIDYPSAFSGWLNVYLNFNQPQKEVAVTGEKASEYVQLINQNYFPHSMISGTEKESQLPFLRDKFAENKLHFFVCENKICHLPLQAIDEVIQKLTI